MTRQSDFKAIVRQRQQITGENYTTARLRVLESANHLAPAPSNPPVNSEIVAVILSCKELALHLRIIGTNEVLTLRARQSDTWNAIPGQLIKVSLTKRWTWRGHPYASGAVVSTWTDMGAMGIEPLPLKFHGECNLKKAYEPFTREEPHYKLWKKAVAAPRKEYEFDPIAWGVVRPDDPDAPENELTCEAAEMVDPRDARVLLMEALSLDIRCIDAHAHLGNLIFERSPERAIEHYKMGVAIGNLSLDPSFDGVLPWGFLYNRPYLRALHGLGLCLWRLERSGEAQDVFERILSLNPPDNQGVRFCWSAVRKGEPWESLQD